MTPPDDPSAVLPTAAAAFLDRLLAGDTRPPGPAGDTPMPPTDPDRTVPPPAAPDTAPLGPPAADLRTGGRLGRYQIKRTLGEGGMGAVYLAHDPALDRPVALKVPKFGRDAATAAERFLREARSAAGLQHPNICPIYDVGEVGGTHYLAMAYVPGRTLADVAGGTPPPDPAYVAGLVRRVALAMQFAHDKGIIHRDLKPNNVLVDEAGEPIVLDFGLARRSDRGDRQITIQGDMMGTPAYMPPEQLAGNVALMGPASDVYSLGVVLYELLVGRPPFEGDTFALLTQIALDPPAPPSARRAGLDPRFDAVCLKALAKKPDERWKSMKAMAEVLAGLAGDPAAGRQADGPTLALRVDGTALAYRPPAVLKAVTIGRQKRRAGDPPDQGNDFVLRVAGNDALSARISRRHLELTRTPAGWAATDRSTAGTSRNGQPLPKGEAVEVADGDKLGVAGVVTLEVVIRQPGQEEAARPAGVVEVPAPPGAGGGRIQLEASLGDVMTMDR